MKIILSRKGYDSQYGRYPSIILKSGEMISFPIPVNESEEIGIKSCDLKIGKYSLAEIFGQLGHNNTERIHHIDPDITSHFMKQSDYGAFGQGGAALGLLGNKEVNIGDIFLFYGTFNYVKETDQCTYQYDYTHPFHSIWGYLKIDRKLDLLSKDDIESINTEKELFFLKNHCHYTNRNRKNYQSGNAIYIGKQYGHLYFNENLRLTKIGYIKSYWKLPSSFKGVDISYHDKENFITNNNDGVEFLSRSRGQEFVFQANEEIKKWVKIIIKNKV